MIVGGVWLKKDDQVWVVLLPLSDVHISVFCYVAVWGLDVWWWGKDW